MAIFGKNNYNFFHKLTHRSVLLLLKQSAMFICKISQNTVNWPTESKTEKLDVAKFKSRSCRCSNVRVIEALVVPTICSTLSEQLSKLPKISMTTCRTFK